MNNIDLGAEEGNRGLPFRRKRMNDIDLGDESDTSGEEES